MSLRDEYKAWLRGHGVNVANSYTGGPIKPLLEHYEEHQSFEQVKIEIDQIDRGLLNKDQKAWLNKFSQYINERIGGGNQGIMPAAGNEDLQAELQDDQQEIQDERKMTQKIFFGAPGTGKSHKIDTILAAERKTIFSRLHDEYVQDLDGIEDLNIWRIDDIGVLEKKCDECEGDIKTALQAYTAFFKEYKVSQRELRTTFHPDYDYAQFVGCYKPKAIPAVADDAGRHGTTITYSFVPQIFAKAYVNAWIECLKAYSIADNDRILYNDEVVVENVYLIIEEINRGNCAQIFGDIFQLLDRDSEGFSQYSIDADFDFASYIEERLKSVEAWDKYCRVVGEGKLRLPKNMVIYATMNTSDQSLFPMDSAFKRRFDWDYVPINYNHREANFIIDVGTKKYNWLDFLKKINENVYSVTKSEDKQMGEFFIKPKDGGRTIKFDEFRSKVLFYLWDSVYKDEDGNEEAKKVFHFDDGKTVTFQTLFEKDVPDQQALVDKIMQNLGVPSIGPAIQVAPNAAAAAEALAEGNNDGGDEGQV